MSRDEADREYAMTQRRLKEPTFIAACDKCDGENDRANESNYCTACREAFRDRTQQQPEQRPGRDWRRS